jgi:hypothetical protein
MKNLATYQRRGFLKDHPPVTQRVLIGSTGTALTLLAGAVLGFKENKYGAYSADADADCILAEDIIVPESGDMYALAYMHAAVIAPELVWAEGVTAEQQKSALVALRAKGIYASEA